MSSDNPTAEPEPVSLVLRMTVSYQRNGVTVQQLHDMLRASVARLNLTGDTAADVRWREWSVALDSRKIEERHGSEKAVVAVGNVADGFKFYGPFDNYDMAAEMFEGDCVSVLHAPQDPQTVDCQGLARDTLAQATATSLCEELRKKNYDDGALQAALDELVHEAHGMLAADINNQGPEAQICFLVEMHGAEEARATIEEAVRNDDS